MSTRNQAIAGWIGALDQAYQLVAAHEDLVRDIWGPPDSRLLRHDPVEVRLEVIEEQRLCLKTDLGHRAELRLEAFLHGAIVLAVAAWQALVEQLALAHFDEAAPLAGDYTAARRDVLLPTHTRLHASERERALREFRSPIWSNCAELFRRLVGDDRLDEAHYETWRATAEKTGAKGTLHRLGGIPNYDDVKAELSAWVTLRHAIAHGTRDLPADVSGQILTRSDEGRLVLPEQNADRCVHFFDMLGQFLWSTSG